MLSREEINEVYEQGSDAGVVLVEGLTSHFQGQLAQLQAQITELENRFALNRCSGKV
jgi:hypothetical protein